MKTYTIDDDQISNFLTERLLAEAGFATEIHSFLSAEDAFNYVVQSLDTNIPDIIFLDLNMPRMNGWEFLDALTPYNDSFLGKCRIYILTSSLDTSDCARSEQYELVYGFIHKPLKPEDIQVILAEIEDRK